MTRRLRPVELDFVEVAPVRLVFAAALEAPPRAVHRALAEDLTDWPRWFDAVSGVTPTRGGDGRDVTLRVGIAFEETVLADDPDTRYAYRVDRTNAPAVTALAEEWRILPGPTGGSRVRWTFAVDGPPAARAFMKLTKPGLRYSFRAAMRALDRRLADSATH
ncbi:SRPBCC family protein [Streptomyces sp. NPDC048057]|uniref:SRPBCC family protein n=1 Tax=Streptomyces sp. NPDC048057 TaxID=3155628 RepID=UPI003404CFDF